MKNNKSNLRASVAAISLFAALPVAAGTTIPSLASPDPIAPATGGWNWRLDLYGWVQALEGDMTIRGNNVPVDLGFDDILENLDFAVMAAIEANYERWSFQIDFSYAEVSGSNNGIFARRELAMDQFIGHGVVAYTVFEDEDTRFQVYGGVRVNSIDADLDVTPNLLPAFSASGSETWVDPIIGVRYARELSDRVFLRAVGDVGGFGVESDFTWQAMAMLGYRFNDWSSAILGYRGIGTDYKSGDFAYDVINHGPVIGLEFRF